MARSTVAILKTSPATVLAGAPEPAFLPWTRQAGSSTDDQMADVTLVAGDAVAVGTVTGTYAGSPKGASDAIVQRIAANRSTKNDETCRRM